MADKNKTTAEALTDLSPSRAVEVAREIVRNAEQSRSGKK